jgi:uncharacterized membrane protein
MKRTIAAAGMAALLALAPAAQAQFTPPKVPSSAKKAKRCGTANNGFADFRVFVGKGRKRITCRTARKVVRQGTRARGWTYYDWTKAGGGPGPWSDVWDRNDHRVVVLAIVRA